MLRRRGSTLWTVNNKIELPAGRKTRQKKVERKNSRVSLLLLLYGAGMKVVQEGVLSNATINKEIKRRSFNVAEGSLVVKINVAKDNDRQERQTNAKYFDLCLFVGNVFRVRLGSVETGWNAGVSLRCGVLGRGMVGGVQGNLVDGSARWCGGGTRGSQRQQQHTHSMRTIPFDYPRGGGDRNGTKRRLPRSHTREKKN